MSSEQLARTNVSIDIHLWSSIGSQTPLLSESIPCINSDVVQVDKLECSDDKDSDDDQACSESIEVQTYSDNWDEF